MSQKKRFFGAHGQKAKIFHFAQKTQYVVVENHEKNKMLCFRLDRTYILWYNGDSHATSPCSCQGHLQELALGRKEGTQKMEIRGLQKTTLLDFPGHVACTVFTGGCNYRCPFCHNASLLRAGKADITEEELFSFLQKRRGILDGVCITGGEPLIHADIEPFLSRIKDLGFLVKLDTNGTFPSRLRTLCEGGLVDYVAMDIKNAPEKYPLTTATKDGMLGEIQKSVSFLLEGTVPFEFRTTLVKGFHTVEDMKKIGQWIKGAERYFLQQFTDSGDVLTEGLSAFSKEEEKALLDAVLPFVPSAALRGV